MAGCVQPWPARARAGRQTPEGAAPRDRESLALVKLDRSRHSADEPKGCRRDRPVAARRWRLSMALLELRGVAKHFGAIEALKGVELDLEPGEVLGLMGDNGAGKSTLVKIIAGNFPPSEGEIRLEGAVKHFHKPVDARAEGIEVVYQDLALCDNLTAAE